MHILFNISQSKSKQTVKLGELADYGEETIFFKNYAEDEAARLVPDLLLFLKYA